MQAASVQPVDRATSSARVLAGFRDLGLQT